MKVLARRAPHASTLKELSATRTAKGMTVHPNLKNPPIVEALIDVQVEQQAPLSAEELSGLRKRLQPEYPIARSVVQHSIQVSAGHGAPTASTTSIPGQGVVLVSTDGLWAARIFANRVTLSRLKGYTNWHDLFAKFCGLWSNYVGTVRPVSICRTAVRYVNRIEIELPAKVQDYFALRPELPDGPQGRDAVVAEAFMRVVLPFEPDSFAAVTWATEPSDPSSKRGTVLFDIDVFTKRPQPILPVMDSRVLDELRVIKNTIFFSSLTPSTLERYS